MKRNNKILFFFLVLCVLLLVVSFCVSIFFYRAPIDLLNTKLQHYSFVKYDDGVITTLGGQELTLDRYALPLFKESEFLKECNEGDSIFARVYADDLSSGKKSISIFSLTNGKTEFLSLDSVNDAYTDSFADALIILVGGILLSLLLALIGFMIWVKKRM